MPASVDKNMFASMYTGQPPWDIGRPQQGFIDVADQITGSVLDAGCGTGENSLYFASRGCQVTGIDFLEDPLQRAKRKTAERGLAGAFLVMVTVPVCPGPRDKDVGEKAVDQPEGRLELKLNLLAEHAAESLLVTATLNPTLPPGRVLGLDAVALTVGPACVQTGDVTVTLASPVAA